MELHFSQASRVLATKPLPLEAQRLVLSGKQVELERLFLDRYDRLKKRGALDNRPERLVDRRPVDMKPTTTIYSPPAKVKVRNSKLVEYDHPLLTIAQRSCRTNTTKGEALDMTNKVAEEKPLRRAIWMAAKKEAKS